MMSEHSDGLILLLGAIHDDQNMATVVTHNAADDTAENFNESVIKILSPDNLDSISCEALQGPGAKKMTQCVDGGTGVQTVEHSLANSDGKVSTFGGFEGIKMATYKAIVEKYGKSLGRNLFDQFDEQFLQGSYVHSCNYHHDQVQGPVHHHVDHQEGHKCHIGCGHVKHNLNTWDEEERSWYMQYILGLNDQGEFIEVHNQSLETRTIDVLQRDHIEGAILINTSPVIVKDDQSYIHTLKSNRIFDEEGTEYQVFEYDLIAEEILVRSLVEQFNSFIQENNLDDDGLRYDEVKGYIDAHIKTTLNKLSEATNLIKKGKVFTVILSPEGKHDIQSYDGLKQLLV